MIIIVELKVSRLNVFNYEYVLLLLKYLTTKDLKCEHVNGGSVHLVVRSDY